MDEDEDKDEEQGAITTTTTSLPFSFCTKYSVFSQKGDKHRYSQLTGNATRYAGKQEGRKGRKLPEDETGEEEDAGPISNVHTPSIPLPLLTFAVEC